MLDFYFRLTASFPGLPPMRANPASPTGHAQTSGAIAHANLRHDAKNRNPSYSRFRGSNDPFGVWATHTATSA